MGNSRRFAIGDVPLIFKVIYLVELTWLFTDLVGGYFASLAAETEGRLGVAAIIRLLVFLLCLAAVVLEARRSVLSRIPIVLVMLVPVWVTAHISVPGPYLVVNDIQFLLKFIFPILVYCVVRIQIRKGYLARSHLGRIVLVSGVVLIFNTITGLLGYGSATYEVDTNSDSFGGIRGFFYSGNELSVVVVLMYGLALMVASHGKRHQMLLVLAVILSSSAISILLMSKTAIFGFMVITLAYFFLAMGRSTLQIGVTVAISIFLTKEWWQYYLTAAIVRWAHFYETTGSVAYLLTSGRTDRIAEFEQYLAGANAIALWWGSGWQRVSSFENDALDLVASYGFVSLFFYLFLIIALFRMALFTPSSPPKLKAGRAAKGVGILTLLLYLVTSVVAGHAMYSATAALFVAICLLYGEAGQEALRSSSGMRRAKPAVRIARLAGIGVRNELLNAAKYS